MANFQINFRLHYLSSGSKLPMCCISISFPINFNGKHIPRICYLNVKKGFFEETAINCWFPESEKEMWVGKLVMNLNLFTGKF